MKNILITINETPYPPCSGGKVDFFYKLKALKELGYNIYLVYSYSNEKDNQLFKKVSNQYVEKFVSYHRKKSFKSVFSFIPYFIISNAPNSDEKKQIDNMLIGIDIDVILVDHLDSFLIGEYVSRKYTQAKLIHRMHNDEAVFLYSVFKTFKVTSPKKWLFGLDSFKMKFYEDRCYQKYENISAISAIEADDLKAKYPNKNIKWIPPFFDFNNTDEILLNESEEKLYFQLKEKLSNKKILLLTASFNGGFNVESTKWFIENVFKTLLQKNQNLVFIIAGFDSDKHFCNSEHILVIPKYESVKPLMKIADLSVIMATGKGGVKLKLMEALNYRKKIVSTVDGVYGSGFEKFIPNTDDKELFLNYCIDALNEKITYQDAYDYFQSKFNCKKNGLEMIDE